MAQTVGDGNASWDVFSAGAGCLVTPPAVGIFLRLIFGESASLGPGSGER
jgi:hypothetical protein